MGSLQAVSVTPAVHRALLIAFLSSPLSGANLHGTLHIKSSPVAQRILCRNLDRVGTIRMVLSLHHGYLSCRSQNCPDLLALERDSDRREYPMSGR